MAFVVVLDSGPTGLLACPPKQTAADQCRAWLDARRLGGATIVLPAIVDFEVRRELIRINAVAPLRRLEVLCAGLPPVGTSPEAFRKAAEFWAEVRRVGKPTADPKALDADAIIAGMAATIGEPWDHVTIATTNAGHFGRFPGIDAREWSSIT
jgi:predicted nucleic acid-binding protein